MAVEVIELQAGGAVLRLMPAAGGRLTACTLVGPNGQPQPVLHPCPEDDWDRDHWPKGGLYPLVPYSGRIRDACLHFERRAWALAPHAGSSHTLHGIAQRRPWALDEHGIDHARLRYTHDPDTHWPWAFKADMTVRLAPSRLQVDVGLSNTGDVAMPAGIGLHPYLAWHDTDRIDYEAGPAWSFDLDYLAETPPADAKSSRPWQLGSEEAADREVTRFHACWRGALHISSAGGAAGLKLTGHGGLDQLVIHRPMQASYVCIEPVSHVADGFNLHAQGHSHTGTRILGPGEGLRGGLTIEV
jgi:aldose 1-epimerase